MSALYLRGFDGRPALICLASKQLCAEMSNSTNSVAEYQGKEQ